MPSTSSLPSIVTNGALLTIEGERRYNGPDSEGGTGFVSRVHDDGTFDINLSVGGVEKNVHPRRIQNSTPLATTARRRSIADDSATRPSLISINHVPSRRSSPVTIAADVSTIAANNTNNQRNDFATMAIHQVIQQCDGRHPKYSNNKSHPLIEMLVWGKKQPKGWARWHDDCVSGNNSIKHDTSKHLTSSLNVLLVDMKRETDRYSELVELAATRGVRGQGPTAMLQHAFDVGKRKVRDCNKIYNEKRDTMERKKRSDAGKTLANSERKREQQCTPLNYFKKLKRQQYPGEVLKDDELRESYKI